MTRLLCYFLLVLLIFFPSTVSCAGPVDKALSASLVIEVKHPLYDMWMPVASATFINDNDLGSAILTAKHVAFDVGDSNLDARACLLIKRDECAPLGLFVIDSNMGIDGDWAFYPVKSKAFPTAKPARISHRPMAVGCEVIQIGVPNQQAYVSHGTIAWIESVGASYVYLVDGFAWPGSSGGGVFDERGRLIGIMTAVAGVADPLLGMALLSSSQVAVVPVNNVSLID